MNVLAGPREEIRRILYEGRPQWVTPDGEELVLGDGRRIPEAEAHYLPPCDPTKIICVHLNYESRRIEFGVEELVTPTYFMKPTTALAGHRGRANRPEGCRFMNYEGELAVVVAEPMRDVAPDEVWEKLAGFTPANDIGIHDFRDTDAGSMLRVKGQDGFCPVGPGLVRGVDVRESTLRTYLDGEVVQEAPLSEMNFGIDYLVADLARYLTLLPGDLILTGTPANSRPMEPGSVVEVEITGVGRLATTIGTAPAPRHDVGFPPTASKSAKFVAWGGDYRRLREEEKRREQEGG
ncbi:MAG TPA: FAA hydrolase family protein [Actinobacteria bacterium]|nr:FAA hydrolase family protein [Actinomycetota bacterium]